MFSFTRLLPYLVLVVTGLHGGICDDETNCDPCVGIPILITDVSTIFEKNCTCDGSRYLSWCFTREDMSHWRYCNAQDRDQGFEVPVHCVPVDCMWASWSEWSVCETEVSTGRLFRFRTRDEIKGINGGNPCNDGRVEHDDTYCYLHECALSPCINGGTCVSVTGSYVCSCARGYTGLNCEMEARLCPDGYEAHENSCYRFGNELLQWSDARSRCLADGADLVTIETQAEDDYLTTKITNCYGAWIGLTDSATEGDWRWVATGNTPLYTDWSAGQPDDSGGEDCGHKWSSANWMWNDAPCTPTFLVSCYICEL